MEIILEDIYQRVNLLPKPMLMIGRQQLLQVFSLKKMKIYFLIKVLLLKQKHIKKTLTYMLKRA